MDNKYAEAWQRLTALKLFKFETKEVIIANATAVVKALEPLTRK